MPQQRALISVYDKRMLVDFARGLIQLAICLVFLGFAQVVFSRLEKKFPERL